MEYRKQAKEGMAGKISRLTAEKYVKTDASDWSPSEPLNADVKTGMRPVSRRAYKNGGKVDMKACGDKAKPRADRPARADGGKATATAMMNRNQKDANEDRDGLKHVGALKRGGRAAHKSGGKVKKAGGGGMKADPYGENDSMVEKVIPKPKLRPADLNTKPKMDTAGMAAKAKAAATEDPFEDRPLVTGYSDGGNVHHDIGSAVGHAMAAYHRMQDRHARKSGGRVGKAGGGGFGEAMNNPKASSGKSKGKTPTINITINTAPKQPPMPPMGPMGMDMPPPPPPGLNGPAGPMAGPPPAPPMMPPAPPGLAAAGGPPPMMPPGMGPKPPFAAGGMVGMDAGAGSGVGRLEKIDAYGARQARKAGGSVHMTAGAGSGEGRLEKIAAYGKKA